MVWREGGMGNSSLINSEEFQASEYNKTKQKLSIFEISENKNLWAAQTRQVYFKGSKILITMPKVCFTKQSLITFFST